MLKAQDLSHTTAVSCMIHYVTIWLCCSWNKLLVRLARGELTPRLSLVSPKVFFLCHRWSFGSLPLSPLACLVEDTSFPAISPTWLHRYYLNWTELEDDITEFNNEMPLAVNAVQLSWCSAGQKMYLGIKSPGESLLKIPSHAMSLSLIGLEEVTFMPILCLQEIQELNNQIFIRSVVAFIHMAASVVGVMEDRKNNWSHPWMVFWHYLALGSHLQWRSFISTQVVLFQFAICNSHHQGWVSQNDQRASRYHSMPCICREGYGWKNHTPRGCGFESRLRLELSTTEVRPLSKAPNPPTAHRAPRTIYLE